MDVFNSTTISVVGALVGSWSLFVGGIYLLYKVYRKEMNEHRKEERRKDKEAQKRLDDALDAHHTLGRLSKELEASNKVNQATYRMLKVAGFDQGAPQQGDLGFAAQAKADDD